ncbi:MAG: anaerobic benzoate catabolism transcriptional regulator [Smithella sp. PtaU1.Bin162]|nr:MAG: anaerobic benzoate catabolism transcriptional regulator [Smithella sp. PtaU1.Bin162]
MEILKQFSVRVKKLRSSRGITQEDLAALSGLSRQYIGDVERAQRNISLLNIEKIAKSFGITISELLNFNE